MSFEQVTAGQVVRASLWNAAKSEVESRRIQPGRGIRIKRTANGTIISANEKKQNWNHPFRVSLQQTSATLTPGYLNARIEPVIGKTSMFGDEKEKIPTLEFKKPKLTNDGRGYIALEVTFDEKWQIKSAEIIQTDTLGFTEDSQTTRDHAVFGSPILQGRKTRWALALIRKQKNDALKCFQITFGDLQVIPRRDAQTNEYVSALFF